MREVKVTGVGGLAPKYLPFYTADRSMKDTKKPHSVEEILRTVFSEDYEKTIRTYIAASPEAISRAIRVQDAKDLALIENGKMTPRTSWKQELSNTVVDFIVPAVIEADVPSEKKQGSLLVVFRRREKFQVTFRMRYVLDLINRQCSAPIVAPIQFFPEDEITKASCADEFLLPIMDKYAYTEAARRMLSLYYPEALKGPTAVDGRKLAQRMGLKIREVWFERDKDVYGRTFFTMDWAHFDEGIGREGYYRVPKGCILINRNLCITPEEINNTIIHECSHVFLDTPFFMLQIMGGNPFTTHASRKKNASETEGSGPEAVMEKQAEKLPEYVLMEEENTQREVKRLIAAYQGRRDPDVMHRVIEQLTKTFQVSQEMARNRLIELGYPEADGVFHIIDGGRIPDHGCGGAWKQGVTYSISRMDAAKLMVEDSRFHTAIRSGKYIYTEGHFCLDDDRYVIRGGDGVIRMSAYARWNVDECCLSFQVRQAMSNIVYIQGQAAKTRSQLLCSYSFDEEPGSKERYEVNQRFGNDARAWMEIRRGGFEDVRTAVFFIMKKMGITQEEISMRLGVSRTAFSNWLKNRISLRHVIAICIALKLRADIGVELVRLAGYSFMNNQEHEIFLSFLFQSPGLTIPRANEILIQHGLKPLTEGLSQELAEVV